MRRRTVSDAIISRHIHEYKERRDEDSEKRERTRGTKATRSDFTASETFAFALASVGREHVGEAVKANGEGSSGVAYDKLIRCR